MMVIFVGVSQINSFEIVYAMTKGGPGTTTSLLAYRLYMEATKEYELRNGISNYGRDVSCYGNIWCYWSENISKSGLLGGKHADIKKEKISTVVFYPRCRFYHYVAGILDCEILVYAADRFI